MDLVVKPSSKFKALKKSVMNKDTAVVYLGSLGVASVVIFACWPAYLLAAPLLATLPALSRSLYSYSSHFAKELEDSLKDYDLSNFSEKLKNKHNQRLTSLEKDISECLFFTKSDPLVNQVETQYFDITRKMDFFKESLSKKFNTSELTYSHFLGIGEAAFNSVVGNLESAVDSFQAIRSIDLDALESRYDKIKMDAKDRDLTEFEKSNLKSIVERINSREKLFYKIEELLSKNEATIAKLSGVAFKISSSKIKKNQEVLETILSDLESIQNNLNKYDSE